MLLGRGEREGRRPRDSGALPGNDTLPAGSVSDTIEAVREVWFTTSARKHRIGKTRALPAMADAGEPDVIPGTGDLDDRLLFVGRDERGVQLEVIAIEQPDHLLVIHVMPYAYRRRSQ